MTGEVAIEIDGKVYTFALGVNALCAVESLFSRSDRRVTFQDVMRLANAQSMTHLRGLLWASLQKHHKEMSLDDVGDLITKVGLDVIDRKFAEMLPSLVPDQKDLAALGVRQGNPRRGRPRKAGTGPNSIARPDVSGSPVTVSSH